MQQILTKKCQISRFDYVLHFFNFFPNMHMHNKCHTTISVIVSICWGKVSSEGTQNRNLSGSSECSISLYWILKVKKSNLSKSVQFSAIFRP